MNESIQPMFLLYFDGQTVRVRIWRHPEDHPPITMFEFGAETADAPINEDLFCAIAEIAVVAINENETIEYKN